MAGESTSRRARAERVRRENVAGGREKATLVRMTAAEQTTLAARAAEGGVSVPRLLVEAALGATPETGRAHAAIALLEMDSELRRVGNNLNQLVRYAHQHREIPEHLAEALNAVVRACLSVDATARWVMGQAPAVSESSVPADLSGRDEWAAGIDPDESGV